MAFENLIQLSFTAEELKKIDDSLAEIEKVLKGKTHNLTPEERKQYGSIAEQNKLFVNKAKLYMEQYPDYVPRYIDKAEFDKDYTAREVLESCMVRLKGITEQVEDTKKLLDFDNYQAALSFYRLTFLETSGENHNEIRGGNNYHKNISKYLQANIPITFIIVTSYQSAHQEDAIINEFFDLLEEKGKNFKNIDLILVISKWDVSGTESPSEEDLHFFIKDRLPMTHGFLEKYGLTQTYYTVGTIEKINGEDRIVNLNLDSSKSLSKWLYKSITGVDIDYEGTMWEQLKWSIGMK